MYDHDRLPRRARRRSAGIRIARRTASGDRRATHPAGADDRHALAVAGHRAHRAAEHHRRRALGGPHRTADDAAGNPRAAARDWRRPVVVFQRPGGHPHSVEAVERGRRSSRHSQIERQNRLPLGRNRCARSRSDPRSRNSSAARARRSRTRRRERARSAARLRVAGPRPGRRGRREPPADRRPAPR